MLHTHVVGRGRGFDGFIVAAAQLRLITKLQEQLFPWLFSYELPRESTFALSFNQILL